MAKNRNKSRKKYTTKIPAVTGDLVKRNDLEEDDTATPVKEEQSTATKIKPMKGDDGLVDMLMKIYTFMNKNYESDKLHREEENNLKEGNKLDEKKRHENLIKAIEDLKKNLGVSDDTASKEDDNNGGGIVSVIAETFGLGRSALSALSLLGGLVATPLGVALIGAVVAGTVGAWMVKQIEADPQAALEGKKGIGMAVAGLGSEGQLPSYEEEQQNKSLEKNAKTVDKKGLKDATVEELKAKKQLMLDHGYGKSKADEIKQIDNEIKSREIPQMATPVSAPAATASPAPNTNNTAAPAAATPASNKLNTVTAENNTAKVDNITKTPSISTINNVTATQGGKTEKPIVPKTKVPPVRNQEPTFQNMIIYSTRVV
jgi:hypothetical protein